MGNRVPMPTLQPITSRRAIQEYHRFRHAIYSTSGQRGFLSSAVGIDVDEFDRNALHFGWYEGGRLVGCVRLIDPVKGPFALHCFKDLPGPVGLDLGHVLLREARDRGHRVCEVGRLCLAPDHRSPAQVRSFVLAIIAAAHRHGRDHCLFSCDRPHAAFWRRMGFRQVPGLEAYANPRASRPTCLMQGHYHQLLALHRTELQRLGLAQLLRPAA